MCEEQIDPLIRLFFKLRKQWKNQHVWAQISACRITVSFLCLEQELDLWTWLIGIRGCPPLTLFALHAYGPRTLSGTLLRHFPACSLFFFAGIFSTVWKPTWTSNSCFWFRSGEGWKDGTFSCCYKIGKWELDLWCFCNWGISLWCLNIWCLKLHIFLCVITFFATLKLLNSCIICWLVLLGDKCESKTYCTLWLCGYRDNFWI